MACKPGSVSCWKTIIHLGSCLRNLSSNQPGQAGLKTSPRMKRILSLFGFAPGGACRAICIAADAVRSYRTFSPLPVETGGSISVALSLGLHRPGVTRRLVSMEPGLSSAKSPRPSGHLTLKYVVSEVRKVKHRRFRKYRTTWSSCQFSSVTWLQACIIAAKRTSTAHKTA